MPRVSRGIALACVPALVALSAVVTSGPSASASSGAGGSAPPVPRPVAAARTGAAGQPKAKAAFNRAQFPSHGRVTVMVQLDAEPAATAYAAQAGHGHSAAVQAFHTQTDTVLGQQREIKRALRRAATKGTVLFGTHALYSGLAVTTDASRLPALSRLPGVQAIRTMTPKHTTADSGGISNVGAPTAWQATGNTGQGETIGIIDTGVDYTHADFGGPGTTAAYDDAEASDTEAPDYPDPAKVSGGYDFAGDAYDASSSNPADETPEPDGNPLDCSGHGTHVAGTAAGYGENADGSTYTGSYDTTVPGQSLEIEPGVAPGAQIVPLKIFGCGADATTDLVSEALDWAADPNGDGDPSDHLDVVNLSLGSDYSSPQDPDAVAAENAADLGIVVVAAAGNEGDVYDAGGSPGNAPHVISVAASDSTGSTNTIASFSSRGIRGANNVKPDITAPGVSITSAAIDTGDTGFAEDGTSMATPHVSGAAAVLRAQQPTWSTARIKAALMDTASGSVLASDAKAAPPMRAGSGLLQVNQALSTSILAYSGDDPGAVSVSFGSVAVTSTTTTTLTKMLTVQSLRNLPTSYAMSFVPSFLPPGVSITLPGKAIALPARASVPVQVTLTINPATLAHSIDPTKTTTGGLDDWITEASGWVVLTPRTGGASLRVPVYAAPRRASTMKAASSATVTSATIGTGTLALSGTGFGNGASSTSGTFASLLTATQLQATSPQLPSCSSTVLTGCVPFSDDRAGDIHYVGTSSDAPYCVAGNNLPDTYCESSDGGTFESLTNVAITTWGPWRTPSSYTDFSVWWDLNGDGIPDALTVNTRLTDCSDLGGDFCDTDQLVAQTYDVRGGLMKPLDYEPLNNAGGALDTDPYDSDAIVMPVWLYALQRAGWDPAHTPRIQYWVTSSTIEDGGTTLDTVGSSAAPLTLTVASPALSAVGDLGLPELNSDKAGSAYTLKVRENSAALLTDLPSSGSPSLLLIHHDNVTGSRAQIVPVKRATTAGLALSKTSTTTAARVSATATVAPSSASGTVTFRDGSTVLGTATLSHGKATLTLPALPRGSHPITAAYGGNLTYGAKTSAAVTLSVS